MKKKYLWMMAATLVSGAGLFASCVDVIDNPAQPDLNVADMIIKNA